MKACSTQFRRVVGAAALLLATSMATVVCAEPTYPNRPVKIVNVFPSGDPSDIISRLVAEKMQASLRQPVIVENRPGAGGNLAAALVAKAPADGYTILTGIDTTFTVNPGIYSTMSFTPDDLKPLMIMASSGLMVAVHPSVRVKTLAELIAKGRTETLSFSSGGNGSPGHLAAAIFGDAAGIKVLHVPYKGNTPAVLALLAGDVQAGILAAPGLLPHVQAGKITALAVTGHRRSLVAPDLPTVLELGMGDLQVEVLHVAMVPAATPEPVMTILRKALSDALNQPDVSAQLAKLGIVVEAQGGKPAQDRISAQQMRYARIIKATGMKID